jgi:hypothetical protein
MEEIHKALVEAVRQEEGQGRRTELGRRQAGFDYAAKTFTKTDPSAWSA